MTRIGMLLLALVLLPRPGWRTDLPLFVMQRSKNAHKVHDYLRVDDRCRLASDKPVSAGWKLLEEGPAQTASLSVFDQMAYGIAHQRVVDNTVSFRLKALEQKRITASATAPPPMGTCAPRAQGDIQGQGALLERISVQTQEGGLTPKVMYVDVFGKSMDASATPVRERITP